MKHLLLLVLLITGCAAVQMDLGIVQRKGVTWQTPDIPVTVQCLLPDCGDLRRAADWWEEETGRVLFMVSETEGVPVRIGYLPADIYGRVVASYDPDDGEVLSMEMILQETEWTQTTLRHELGHVLCLDDDVFSVEDLSIMSTPNGKWSVVTPHDLRLLQRM